MQTPDIATHLLTRQRSFLARVYTWMTLGLMVTALTALVTLTQERLLFALVTNPVLLMGLLLLEVALVVTLGGMMARLTPATATAGFLAYAALNGVTLSVVFLAYTGESIAGTFVIAAGMFGVTGLYGFVTKRDLSSWGSLLLLGLIGLLLASVVNIVLQSSTLYWATSYAGVLLFLGLTAYDTQKIKRIGMLELGESEAHREAILGALALYLDFINLFLFLLRIFGRRR